MQTPGCHPGACPRPENRGCTHHTTVQPERDNMLSIKISVAESPYSTSRITLRHLDQLLLLHGQEGRAGDAQALPGAVRRRVTKPHVCAHCGAPFKAATSRAMYCPGGRCKAAAYRARKAAQRRKLVTCAGCSERFKPVNGNHRYCSGNCRSRTWKRQQRGAWRLAA